MRPGTCCIILLFAATAIGGRASDLQPRMGRGLPPPNGPRNGPWSTRLMLAASTNGLDFTRLHFVLSDQASGPNVVIGAENRARVYYVDYGNSNVIACAVQSDPSSLTNWTHSRVHIQTIALPAVASNPTVVMLSDHRYRLYFARSWPQPGIYSALSTNGNDFSEEPGVRISGFSNGIRISDPLILKTENVWRLWCGPDVQITANSSDGLTFHRSGDFRVEGARFMPWSAVVLPIGGGYRLYGNFLGPGEWSGGISSVSSSDGSNWKREAGIRLSLDGSRYRLEGSIMPDHGCALLPSGKWLLAYVATIPVPRPKR